MRALLKIHDVTISSIDDDVTIRVYAETEKPMNKAEAYGIQSLSAMLVKKIDSNYFNVIGFPIYHFCTDLEALINAEIK